MSKLTRYELAHLFYSSNVLFKRASLLKISTKAKMCLVNSIKCEFDKINIINIGIKINSLGVISQKCDIFIYQSFYSDSTK